VEFLLRPLKIARPATSRAFVTATEITNVRSPGIGDLFDDVFCSEFAVYTGIKRMAKHSG
jgi:hypothetical protein